MKMLNLTLLISVVLFGSLAFAGGVIRPGATLSPRGLGMAGAQNAIANDGAALYHNVAGLAQAEENFVQLNADLIFPKFKYESEQSQLGKFLMPEITCGIRLSQKMVLGCGIYTPYGLGATYSGGSFQKSFLAVVNNTIALSYQLSDTLSVGIAGDLGFGQLKYNSALHQIGDIVFKPAFLKTDANGFGLGFRAGILWQPDKKFSLGLSYSSPMKIHLTGKTDFSLFGLELGTDKFNARVSFPARFGSGIAFRPNDNLVLAFDVNYYDFSQTDSIDFDFKLLPLIRQKLQWENNWSVHLGAEQKITDNFMLRSGIAWMNSAVPKETANPIIPDGDGYCFGIGCSYKMDNWSIDLAYLYAWTERKVENFHGFLSPGDYKTTVNVVSAGLTYRF